MRLFIGVELDDAVRASCAAAGRDLLDRLRTARGSLDVRWILEDNLHITLWFLGEVDDQKAHALRDVLAAGTDVAGFPLTIADAGAFPPWGPPRILWLGIREGADGLRAIHRELAVRLAPLGFETERRPYHPHVTIGRVREARPSAARKLRDELRRVVVRGGAGRARLVTLFQSRLSPAGARYEPLLRVPLTGC